MSTIAVTVGYLAMAITVGSYSLRSHRALTYAGALAMATWAVHYGLQGAWTASGVAFLVACRIMAGRWVVHWATKARWQATMVGWLATVGTVWWTWSGGSSVPSAVASIYLVWAGFHLHYRALRVALLTAETLWFLNGCLVGSTPAMLTSALCFALNGFICVREVRAARMSAVSA